jgi:hypothetical protein
MSRRTEISTPRRSYPPNRSKIAQLGGENVQNIHGVEVGVVRAMALHGGIAFYRANTGSSAGHAPNVNRVPTVERITFPGISALAISPKVSPVQCAGTISSGLIAGLLRTNQGCARGQSSIAELKVSAQFAARVVNGLAPQHLICYVT